MTYQRKEIIGNCTLYLADCMDVLPTLGKVDAVVTDPPYGMSFQSNHRAEKHMKIANDETAELAVAVIQWALTNAKHSVYAFGRWDNVADYPKPKSLITWVKNNWSMGNLHHEHARQTEVAFFYARDDHKFPKARPTDVVFAPRTGNENHPTEKPVCLMQQFVEWTHGVVIDPFMGSGTTGVACVKLGRSFIGIERELEYFEIACRRIREAYAQPDMFIQPPTTMTQEALI